MFIAPLRLSTPLSSAEAVRFRRDVSAPLAVEPVSRVERSSEQAAVLHLGSQALSLARREQSLEPEQGGPSDADADAAAEETPERDTPQTQLSDEESKLVQELRRRDREVRSHEQAHKTAGGQHAGSIHLEYETGADGKRYAVSGEVAIDVSPVSGDPDATLRKMQAVRRAASAPANPSGADRQVATQAAQLAQQARAEMAAERYASAERLGASAAEPQPDNVAGGPRALSERPPGKGLALFA